MRGTDTVDWARQYADLLVQLKNAQDTIASKARTIERTKRMVIEAETTNMELEQIFNQSSSGIWVIDTNFEILRMNETLAKLAGRNKNEVRGLKCYEVFPISLCATHNCPMSKINGERQNLEYDIERETKNGILTAYLLTINPFYGLTGKTMGLVAEFKDITLRRRAEGALRQANKTLQRLSDMDGLTEVSNRRRFDDVLKIEWKRANRSYSPLSLIFCDIDYFKLFNDTYGHQAGDECLRAVARVIRANVHRPEDLVARYGGEEFILVLPNTDMEGAFHLAETIREALARKRITHRLSPIHPYITLSLGISSIIPNQCTDSELLAGMPDALVKLADQALYKAKQRGRNRTETADSFKNRAEEREKQSPCPSCISASV
jgi:diguanylate cyclase (GGDEF)-like protein/PAS domain S-box-containing protein